LFGESSPEQVRLDNLGCGLVGKRTGLDVAHVGLSAILLDLSMHTTCEVATASDKSWIRSAGWMLYIAAAGGDHRAAPIDVSDLRQLDPLGA
jgi:hypothetical protein